MNKYEQIKADMTSALREGNKLKRLVLSDIVSTIDRASTSGKTRVEITDAFVNDTLIKYKKTVQEMVDTCPNDEKYADTKANYLERLKITEEYAPNIIDSVAEIEKMIAGWGKENNIELVVKNKGVIMKSLMPWLKQNFCDMKAAQDALKNILEVNK